MTVSHAVFAGFALVAAAVLFSGEFSAQAKKAPGDAASAAYAPGPAQCDRRNVASGVARQPGDRPGFRLRARPEHDQ